MLPPPLSLSAPDLRSEWLSPPPLRRSASSTELLYEKAMQKFYQAVEVEEAENERKRSMSIGPKSRSRPLSPDYLFANNNNSIGVDEADGKSNRRGSLTKYNTLDESRGKDSAEDSGSDTYESEWDEEDDSEFDERDIKKEIMESQQKPITDYVYEDDYTESTVSTCSMSAAASIESIEQFINNIRSSSNNNIRKNSDDELETYHPSTEARALSPYRSPEPGQAAIVLSQPLSLPDPDYVPKPILKRPSNENNGKENKAKSPIAAIKSESKNIIQQIFDRKKTPSNDNLKSSRDELTNESAAAVATKDTKPTAVVSERDKTATLRRQISTEENKVAIDHYSDLVRELGGMGRAKVPIYMRGQADTEWRDSEKDEHAQSDASEKLSEPAQSIKSNDNNSESMREVQPIPSQQTIQPNHIVKPEKCDELVETNSPSMERLASPDRGNLVEISVEHTQSISYALREIKPATMSAVEPAKSSDKREGRTSDIATKRIFHSATNSRSSSVTRATPVEIVRKVSAPPAATGAVHRTRTQSRTRTTTTRSASKSPASLTRASLTSTVLKVTRLPLNENYENIAINLSPSMSMSSSPEPCRTPEELMEEAEVKVKSSMNYTTDMGMFLLACWLYLFKDARLAIPILALMVFRQLQSVFMAKYGSWMKSKKS